jgi:uncharacterized protein YbbK (DUF523 family)
MGKIVAICEWTNAEQSDRIIIGIYGERTNNMKILISACLLGSNCKYNGGNNRDEKVMDFIRGHEIVSVCPEVMAGLGTPRTPVEIVNGNVQTKDGISVDAALRAEAARIVEQAKAIGIDCAVLKSRSPTCGVNEIYDGTFSGRRIKGSGVLAQVLKDAGIRVIDSEDVTTIA